MPELPSFSEALAVVLTHARSLSIPAIESVPLNTALGRVLAEPVHTDRDQPPFPRSTRDGFALRTADADTPRRIIATLHAGEPWQLPPVAPGEAVEIMTGAAVPPGADAVLMLEHATRTGDILTPHRTLAPNANIVPRGAEARAGATVLPAGRVLRPAEIAVAASCGRATLPVFRRPLVAVLSTGDELVNIDDLPGDFQIRNSNTYALTALVRQHGGEPLQLPIARDTLDSLRTALDRAAHADLLLITGGVSLGKRDLVEAALAERHATFHFTGALIQPGKPVVFASIPSTLCHPDPELREEEGSAFGTTSNPQPVFGLPGNPVSAQVCLELFVVPLLRALSGRTDLAPRFLEARLAEPVSGGTHVTRFLPAELDTTIDATHVRLTHWQGSGDLTANARGDCYAVIPPDSPDLPAGTTVRVLLR